MLNTLTKIRLALAVSLFVLLACNLTNPVTPNDSSIDSGNQQLNEESVVIEGLCDNPLYPVKQNATWTYSNTGSPVGDFTYTDTITEVRSDGFTLTSTFSGLTRTQAWACDTGGLRALEYNGGPTATISTQSSQTTFNTLEVTGTTLPKEIVPGMQWLYGLTIEGNSTTPDGQQLKSNGTYTVTMQEMGTETVTVPAGTFEATKFQATTTLDIISDVQGIQVPIKITGSTTFWYAPGVGQIKAINNSDFGGGETFTDITELQSYSIP